MKNSKIEREARKDALEDLNNTRQQSGLKPLRAIPPAWWNRYGAPYVETVKFNEGLKGNTSSDPIDGNIGVL